MKITVERTFRGPKYTIGHLYIDGKYFCDTLEDPDRGLTQEMSLQEIKKIKVKGALMEYSFMQALHRKTLKGVCLSGLIK